MKKQTKTGLTIKLDREVSRIIRSLGYCVSCKNSDYSKLQCAHIFSRTYRNTRWDLKNLICLCAGCHFQAHKNPIMFVERVKDHLGDYEYTQLKLRHNTIKRWTLFDMQELLTALKGIK